MKRDKKKTKRLRFCMNKLDFKVLPLFFVAERHLNVFVVVRWS